MVLLWKRGGDKDQVGRSHGKLLPQFRPKTVKICTIRRIVRIIRIFVFWTDLEDKAKKNC